MAPSQSIGQCAEVIIVTIRVDSGQPMLDVIKEFLTKYGPLIDESRTACMNEFFSYISV